MHKNADKVDRAKRRAERRNSAARRNYRQSGDAR